MLNENTSQDVYVILHALQPCSFISRYFLLIKILNAGFTKKKHAYCVIGKVSVCCVTECVNITEESLCIGEKEVNGQIIHKHVT